MSGDYRALLKTAKLEHAFVVALFVDIRDFSSYGKTVESPVMALFITKVYTKLIDEYFTNASFIKPTGDGLLIVFACKPEDLKEVSRKAIETSLSVVRDFGSFKADEPLLLGAPDKVGIGISMGAACRLVAEGKELDYCGRPLNLASRLTDMARPSGVVFDGDVGIAIPNSVEDQFWKMTVYAPGIAPARPGILVYYTKEFTSIPLIYTSPLEDLQWRTTNFYCTFSQLKKQANTGAFALGLSKKVSDFRLVQIRVTYPKSVRQRIRARWLCLPESEYTHIVLGGRHKFLIGIEATKHIVSEFAKVGVKQRDRLRFEVRYPFKD